MRSFVVPTSRGNVTVTHAPTAGTNGRWALDAPWSEPNPVIGTEGEIRSYIERRATQAT